MDFRIQHWDSTDSQFRIILAPYRDSFPLAEFGAAEAWYPVGGPRLGIDRIRRTVDLEKQARVTLA